MAYVHIILDIRYAVMQYLLGYRIIITNLVAMKGFYHVVWQRKLTWSFLFGLIFSFKECFKSIPSRANCGTLIIIF